MYFLPFLQVFPSQVKVIPIGQRQLGAPSGDKTHKWLQPPLPNEQGLKTEKYKRVDEENIDVNILLRGKQKVF